MSKKLKQIRFIVNAKNIRNPYLLRKCILDYILLVTGECTIENIYEEDKK